MQPNTFSCRLHSGMIMLHHRTLTNLCEWADGWERPGQMQRSKHSIEHTVKNTVDTVFRKAARLSAAVEGSNFEDNDEYRNNNRGMLFWGPSDFEAAEVCKVRQETCMLSEIIDADVRHHQLAMVAHLAEPGP